MSQTKVPVWYWIVAGLALLWTLAGCFSYIMHVRIGPAELAAMPQARADLFRSLPGWFASVFAIAVWVGLIGAILLLLRRRLALPAFIVSLIAAVIQFGYMFAATTLFSIMSFGEAAAFPIVIILVGMFLVWFASFAGRKGWLR